MTLEEARQILGLGLRATRQEIRAAYRRAARRWHPDRAPGGAEADYRARMQEINRAYHLVLKFLENYRYHLAANLDEDPQQWWHSRFGVGVWGPPPKSDGEDQE